MRSAFGVDLGGTNLRVALVSEDGRVLGQSREKTPNKDGPEATCKLIVKMIERLSKEHSPEQVEGVGIGSPGPLSRAEKKLFRTVNLVGFNDFPLGKKVEELSGLKVALDNDAKCAAYGEALFGEAKGLRNYILMTFGTGIGGGIVVDGRMVYGKSDGACELGHLTLYPDGEPCPCGNRGCFERYASAAAVGRRSSDYFGKPLNAHEVFEKLKSSDMAATALVRVLAKDIAIATGTLVNLFDPEAIVFGGGLFSDGGGLLLDWIKEEIKGRCFESSQKGLRLVASSLGGNAGLMGAASLVLSQKH